VNVLLWNMEITVMVNGICYGITVLLWNNVVFAYSLLYLY